MLNISYPKNFKTKNNITKSHYMQFGSVQLTHKAEVVLKY